MEESASISLEERFTKHVLDAVNEVRKSTRIGVQRFGDEVAKEGGVAVAKKVVRRNIGGDELTALLEVYSRADEDSFLDATVRIGRPELAIESLMLEGEWSSLFSDDEITVAREKLSKRGLIPGTAPPPIPSEIPGTLMRLRQYGHLLEPPEHELCLPDPFLKQGTSPCDATAEWAAKFASGVRTVALRSVRQHLSTCPQCQMTHSALWQAYGETDEHSLEIWRLLLEEFQKSRRLEFEDLRKLLSDFWEPDTGNAFADAGWSDEEYSEWRQVDELQIYNGILLPNYGWRSLCLGVHLGRYMYRVSYSFPSKSACWSQWRRGEGPSALTEIVRSIPEEQYLLAVSAMVLTSMRYWPREAGGLLWLPGSDDLSSVEPILHVEECDFDDWPEILGEPPKDFSSYNLLQIAKVAAVGILRKATVNEQDEGQAALLGAMFRIEERISENLERTKDIQEKQNAEIDQLTRMVACMETTDRCACEEELKQRLGAVYGRLSPETRSLLLGATQAGRVPNLAAPSLIVQGMAAAFERQMHSALFEGMFQFLYARNVSSLRSLQERNQATGRPLFDRHRKASSLTIGDMEQLLGHPNPEIEEFCSSVGVRRAALLDAIGRVRPYRNDAAHGKAIDLGTARALMEDWLSGVDGHPGIFTVIFPRYMQ